MKLPPQFTVGYRAEIGQHVFTAEEIIRFAEKYDPQPFHLDEEAARNSIFGGLCASGWHTAGVWMRKQRDHAAKVQAELAEQGYDRLRYGPSPGFDDLKWLRPVFAGDTITYFNETLACRKSRSKPGWWVLTANQSGQNQHGEPVISFNSSVLLNYPA